MFIGEYHHALDEKGRLQVPAKWRSQLAGGVVLTKGFDASLKLYPLTVWQEIAAKLAQLPQAEPDIRAYVRQTLAGAADLDLDKTGRLVLPPYLRQYANLHKTVILAGLQNHIELWDETRWQQYLSQIDPNTPDFSQHLQTLGI